MSANNEFREWMDARGLKADDVAAKFDVSPQTISHWRSQGVPDRRLAHVRYIMNSWEGAPRSAPAAAGMQTLVIHPTRDQFRNWNTAALRQGLLIEQWAIEGLDRMAGEEESAKHRGTRPPDPSPLRSVLNEEEPRQAGNGTEGK